MVAATAHSTTREANAQIQHLRVLVVTNMFPNPSRPALGIFVREQVESLTAHGLHVDVLFIDGPANKLNYLRGIIEFRRRIADQQYDLIHAHYVYSGLIARLQRTIPIILTFHSGEVFGGRFERSLSNFLAPRVDAVVAVSSETQAKLPVCDRVIPCGVDLARFQSCPQVEAREHLGLAPDRKLILFAAAMRPEKRYDLAAAALLVVRRSYPNADLLVLTNQPPEVVPLYMSACDALVLTSDKEGSPQVVKEAMACGLPIVSVPVGDVPEVLAETPGCFLCTQDPNDIGEKLTQALNFERRTDGRNRVARISTERIASQLIELYREMLASRRR